MRILVVDDDPAVRRSLEHALRRDGYEVSSAGDGRSALAAHGEFRPDAVVLDVLWKQDFYREYWRVDQSSSASLLWM